MAQYLYWQELTRPGRWPKSLRPAMAGLEARLPGMMGVNIWLHRNVSVSDLELIGNPSVSPTADELWPLMYLVCRFRKALLGVQLVNRKEQDTWKVETLIMEGVPCFSYAIDTENPAADLESILDDLNEEARKLQKRQKPLWQCRSNLVRMDKEGRILMERGLVEERAGSPIPTQRGEDCGLMTLFVKGRAPEVRCSPSTWRALIGGRTNPASLQARVERLRQGMASTDAYAAEAVLQLAEMPLEDYFRPFPEVSPQDLNHLRKALGLPDACRFRTAAAELCHRLSWEGDPGKRSRLHTLLALLAMPIAGSSDQENKIVLKNFRKEMRSL